MSKKVQHVTPPITKLSFRVAFSLVELSIVLVILGLLAGAIMTGKSLIRAAQLREIPVEFQQYQMASNQFLEKYRQLPGDMRNATDFFGAAATCPATNAVPLTGRETCNGDGDGLIESNVFYETFTFWQHLANGGMIEGQYNGAPGTIGNYDHNELNSPESSFPKAGWQAGEERGFSGYNGYFFNVVNHATPLPLGNVLMIGDDFLTTIGDKREAFLAPQEAWHIDTKMDDGKPVKGKVMSLMHSKGCTTTSDPLNYEADYNLDSKSIACRLVFPYAF